MDNCILCMTSYHQYGDNNDCSIILSKHLFDKFMNNDFTSDEISMKIFTTEKYLKRNIEHESIGETIICGRTNQ
ncbi:unnamed protein product, partial [Schistosoma haematobium]